MRRYWVPPESLSGDQVKITGDVFHHIFDVCRQEVGSHFEVLDDQGTAHLVEVVEVLKHSAVAQIKSSRSLPRPKPPSIHLALSVPRFPVLESVLEKAVELGVAEVRLFFSKQSFVRSMDKISAGKMERWNKIILSATQQSGRGDRMKLGTPWSWSELLKEVNPSAAQKCLLAYEGSTPRGLRTELQSLPLHQIDKIWLIAGAEGGFHPSEVQELERRQVPAVTLGEQVLRVETACIALVSALKYEAGHFGGTDESNESKRPGSNTGYL